MEELPFHIKDGKPALFLAPMEGVTDSPMRALLTEQKGFTHVVTEFLRISHEVLPRRVYVRHLPELKLSGRTPAGVPIWLQLLGGDPGRMAASAQLAVQAGAQAIDLNFGCPAPTVNKHDGGATLLQYPHRIKDIVAALKEALPSHISLTVKIRLGWEDDLLLIKNCEAAIEGGAEAIAIHGRTKKQGYKPPALWGPIKIVKEMSPIPVVANGDIWTEEDFLRCQEETGCEHFMLGRSALANPFLPSRIAKHLGLPHSNLPEVPSPSDWRELILRFFALSIPIGNNSSYAVKRAKQWLRYGHIRNNFADFEKIKRCETIAEFCSALEISPEVTATCNAQ